MGSYCVSISIMPNMQFLCHFMLKCLHYGTLYCTFSPAALACLARQLTVIWSCLRNLWKSGNHVCSISGVGLRLSKCISSRVFCPGCVITSTARSTFSLSQCYKETLFQLFQVIVHWENLCNIYFSKRFDFLQDIGAECYIRYVGSLFFQSIACQESVPSCLAALFILYYDLELVFGLWFSRNNYW